MLPKLRAGWLPSALLLLACDHTLVVGEHGAEDASETTDAAPEASAAEGAAGAPGRDAAPDTALDSPGDAMDSPFDATLDAHNAIFDASDATFDASDATLDASDAALDTRDAALDTKIADSSEASDERRSGSDASLADAVADRARVPGCLPDGAAGLTFKSSGGLDLDIMRGNEITCSNSVTGSKVSLTDKAGQILSGLAALETNLVFDDLPRGHTGTTPVLVKITLIAGAIPPVWTSAPAQCSADVTTNAFVENEDGGALYEVGGTITCNGALAPAPDNSSAALTISTFSFVTGALYP